MRSTQTPMFTPVARGLFFVLQMFALYLLLRGHHLPGGGFIGGLVSAISWMMLSLALGWDEMRRLLRVDAARLAAVGLAISAGTWAAPVLFGGWPLQHVAWHLHLPFFGELHVGTALVFDVGVFMVVVGIAVKMIEVLGRSTAGLPVFERGSLRRYSAVAERPIEEPGVSGGSETGGSGEADVVRGKEEGHAG